MTTVAPATAAPAGGQTYTDGQLGFSLAVPSEWELCQNTGWSRLFCRKQAAAAGPAFPRFYVTALPPGFTNADASAYNFISEEHVKAFMALPANQSFTTDGTPGYSTFTRLPDTTVDGLPGVVIENSRVWEGNANTRDRRVLVKAATATYMFGTYYVTAAEFEEFERGAGRGAVYRALAGGWANESQCWAVWWAVSRRPWLGAALLGRRRGWGTRDAAWSPLV